MVNSNCANYIVIYTHVDVRPTVTVNYQLEVELELHYFYFGTYLSSKTA